MTPEENAGSGTPGDDARPDGGGDPRRGDEGDAPGFEGGAVTLNASSRGLAQSLRAAGVRIRSGDSGALPVVLAVILIAIIFQSLNDRFLSPGNLVNLLVQAAVFMLIGMGEVFVLLLGEIDLSLGYVAGIGGVVVTELVQPKIGWPWWAAILVALLVTAAIGAFQGTLITRLRLPSFVVTLAGLLGWQGLMILLLGTGGTIPIPDAVINAISNGTLSPAGGWILVTVVVLVFALITFWQDGRRRASGLIAPPIAVTALKVGAVAFAGLFIVLLTNIDRGVRQYHLQGMPIVLPVVFAVLVAWSFLLGRTRFGRYIYAIGGNAEAARRAGISLAWIRTAAFTLAGMTAGIGGIVYASRLRSMSTSFDGGTIVLYVVATAVIGGTSLFGGRGRPLDAVLGGIVIAAIVNGMALLGFSAAIQLIATAVVLLASIMVDVIVRRRGTTEH